MADANDMDLMREYAEGNSETAFAELVQRHINLVYSAALRYTGNAADAQDVTQAVFIILTKKISSLRQRATLTGWLYETTRFTARQLLRTRFRQQARDQEVYMDSLTQQPGTDPFWKQLGPVLEDAMSRLGEKDRALLALRFFENKSVAETASLLGLNEWTVRKRAERAVEKLREFFSRRGIAVPASALTASLSVNSIQAAPVGLAKTISTVALAKGVAAPLSTITIVKGTLKLMAWTKTKSIVVTGVVVLLAAGTAALTVKAVENYTAPSVETYFKALSTSALDSAPPLLVLRPTHYPSGDYAIGGTNYGPDGRVMLRGATFTQVLSTAYLVGGSQMILPSNLPAGRFDVLLTLAQNPRQVLQGEIKKQFGIVGHMEMEDTDVFVLRVSQPGAPGLKISQRAGPQIGVDGLHLNLRGYKMTDTSGYDFIHLLSSVYGRPVLDETGLTDAYDIDLAWDSSVTFPRPPAHGDAAFLKEFTATLHNRLGLELVPANRPMEMLVVERVN